MRMARVMKLGAMLGVLHLSGIPVEAQPHFSHEPERFIETCDDFDVDIPFELTGTTTILQELSCNPPPGELCLTMHDSSRSTVQVPSLPSTQQAGSAVWIQA